MKAEDYFVEEKPTLESVRRFVVTIIDFKNNKSLGSVVCTKDDFYEEVKEMMVGFFKNTVSKEVDSVELIKCTWDYFLNDQEDQENLPDEIFSQGDGYYPPWNLSQIRYYDKKAKTKSQRNFFIWETKNDENIIINVSPLIITEEYKLKLEKWRAFKEEKFEQFKKDAVAEYEVNEKFLGYILRNYIDLLSKDGRPEIYKAAIKELENYKAAII